MTPPMIDIAYLTSQYPRATDTFIREEVAGLRQMGFNVHPFSIRRPDTSQWISDEIRAEGQRTCFLLALSPVRLAGAALRALVSKPGRFIDTLGLCFKTGAPGVRWRVRQMAYFFEACALAEEMARRGVRHLHNHMGENSANVAMLASNLSGIPYSLTIHGPYIFFAPRQWALGEKIRRSAFTACITSFCRSQCMIFTPAEAWDRMSVVHCGLNERFLGEAAGPVTDEPQLVNVGRLCAEKGQLLLVKAMAELKRLGVAAQLVLVGDGEMRGDVESEIGRHGLGDRVRITGWVDSDRVRQEVAAARALVSCSFAEGLPRVVIEALGLGRPVVGTAIAGMPELVIPGENGWLVPAGSIDALVKAMREAIETPAARLTAMGEAGRARVLAEFDARIEQGKLAKLIAASVGVAMPQAHEPTTAAAVR